MSKHDMSIGGSDMYKRMRSKVEKMLGIGDVVPTTMSEITCPPNTINAKPVSAPMFVTMRHLKCPPEVTEGASP
jgi:hypothetical protein